jgi:hypothetical protein
MKKLMKTTAVWFALIAVIFCTCSDDSGSGNNQPDYNMTGTYTFTNTGGSCTWIFSADGRYQCTGYGILGTKTGTWSSKGNDVTISYATSDGGSISGNEVFTVQENGNQLTLALKDKNAPTSFVLNLFMLAAKSVILTKTSSSGNIPSGFDMTGTYLFKNNGNNCMWGFLTRNYSVAGYGINETKSGTWSSSGNDITISYETSDGVIISGKEVFTVQENGNQLTLTLKDSLAQTSWLLNTFSLSAKSITLTKMDSTTIFTSIGDFEAYLSVSYFDDNDTTIKLNINDLGGSYSTAGSVGKVLGNNYNKYVFLDLSGSTITSIPEQAFGTDDSRYGRYNLTGITLPNSVTNIGDYAFSGCSGLTSITIPSGVTSIGRGAFGGCTGLNNVIIPDRVTSIGDYAFSKCTGLTGVTIGNSVTSIGNYAFTNCTGLTGVNIPDSVTSIGYKAFEECASLTAINVNTANTTYSSQDGVLYNKAKTTLIRYPARKTGAFTIPNSVTSIGFGVFSHCTGLTSITIGNGVTRIEYDAFYGCTNLTSITIPSSVTSFGNYAFSGCTNLTSVTFQGTIQKDKYNGWYQDGQNPVFLGDLYSKFYAIDSSNGTPGTYITTAPVNENSVWTKQP